MPGRLTHALRAPGVDDPSLLSRLLGLLMLSGGALVVASVVVIRPEDSDATRLYAIGAAGLVLGLAGVAFAAWSRASTVHALFAAGTGLISLGIYFAGMATGMYAVMFVWLVVVAASFFSPRAIAGHVAWILLTSGVAIGMVGTSAGVPPLARWAVGSALLVLAAAMMSQIVAGRRATEEQLRAEIEERERLQRELEHLAHHDPLTGLANRRRLEQELVREVERAKRQATPLCVVALDIDDLKRHNDSHGHAAGDSLLRIAASAWSASLRATDLIARTGGDEFVALLPDCSRAEAGELAKRLREGVPFRAHMLGGDRLLGRRRVDRRTPHPRRPGDVRGEKRRPSCPRRQGKLGIGASTHGGRMSTPET